jgi:hypothetical protein
MGDVSGDKDAGRDGQRQTHQCENQQGGTQGIKTLHGFHRGALQQGDDFPVLDQAQGSDQRSVAVNVERFVCGLVTRLPVHHLQHFFLHLQRAG